MSSQYELRAEHQPGEMARNGHHWHVVRHGSLLGLCGRLTSPVGELQEILLIDDVRMEGRCPSCWAAYDEVTTPV
ncbi:hypothetical protein [Streptacidiphilus jiangxiensis]|uniref:Zinc-finger n=1 Tax=Streptacidiphilus jiangxiensis TaxID=235985 RepID=A0A1H7V3K2_STRJI|nr:hypothetical protein [Streptacidiphilus jiangxiensis]SEM03822.1 hypothetical protein SAMN05414137_11759 [Streptacidiphilus jiangxiensis]